MSRSRSSWLSRWSLAVGLLLVTAAPARAQFPIRNCTTLGQNQFVRDVMRDLYFWSEHVPNLDPARYNSPEAFLDAVRYRTLDSTFSYITTRASNDAFYSDSQFIGFGLSTQTVLTDDGTDLADVRMRLSQVFADSPAAEAGLARGDVIVSVGGVSISDWWRSGRLGEVFGPSQIGYETQIVFQRAAAERQQATMTKRLVTIPTVSSTRVIDVDGRKVGYLFFRNFVSPSIAALDEAFAMFKEAKVSEVVLDVRYNGGGLVSVAEHLAELIGGIRTKDQVLLEYFHNDRNAFRNQVVRFQEAEHALTLDRVVIITTRSSASASELIINALRPFMPVITIGDTTYGKPVGQYGLEFCDKVLAPVSFTIRNANGEGDFFGGIAPTCQAPDDLEHQIADLEEGSLAEALHFIQYDACRTTPSLRARTERGRSIPTLASGFDQLVGAR